MLYTTIKIPNHVTVSVTSAGVLALPANPRRFYATLVNQSNVPIWIKLGSMAAVDDGIYIAANGFSYEIDLRNLWLGDIYAIHNSGGSKIMTIIEGY
jgi:hypothetical protein